MIQKIKINDIDQIFNSVPGINEGDTRYSIPDVYGRAIRLGIILMETQGKSENELPEEIWEWRGILTLLALKDFLELDIQIESIPLTSLPESEKSFRKAITLTPKKGVIKHRNWDWNTYHIIKIKGKTGHYQDIALFSPSTLIYPIADLNEVMPKLENVKWFSKNGFVNPVGCLNEEQREIVYYWIQAMIKELRPISDEMQKIMANEGNGQKQDVINIVIRHLKMYCANLKAGGKGCFGLDAITSGMSGYEAYKFINQTVKTKVYVGNKEFYFKDTFADAIQCFKGSETDNVFMNCVNGDKHRIEKGTEKDTTDGIYAILPFGKKLVQEVSEEELKNLSKNIKMWWVGKRNVAVKMCFSNIDSRNMDITKIITCTEGDFLENSDTQLALWPKIRSTNWTKYYLYYYKGVRNFEVCGNKGKRKDRLGGYVYEYNEYPFKIQFEEDNGRDKKYLGVLLPQEETYVNNGNRTAEVAIDFGTSGTVCFANIDGLGEKEILFNQESSMWLLKGYSDQSATQVAQNFVPLDIEEKRMYSVYKAYNNNVVNKADPILDGIIYYAKNMEIIPDGNTGERFLTNLKWMMNTDGIWYQNFVCQLCMQITLYLKRLNVGVIHWRYALPLSLGQNDQAKVKAAWQTNMNFLESIDTEVSHRLEDMTSESQAISNYFYEHKTVDNLLQLYEETGYIIVDIGGGSTDFSMWQKGSGVSRMWETSVPVASRKLFSEVVFDVIHDIGDLYSEGEHEQEQLRAIEKLWQSGKKDLGIAFLEKFVADHSEDLQEKLRIWKSVTGCGWIGKFRNKLSVGAAMVLYCAGQMLGEKLNSGDIVECSGKTFYVVLAGNGSKLFDWVFDQKWEESNNKQKFVNVFLEGVRSRYHSINMEICIAKSPEPKQEVAQGLLLSNANTVQESLQKGSYGDTQILNWKNCFVDVYENNFAAINQGTNASWNNIAARTAQKCEDSCNLMLQDILKYL